MEPIHTTYHSDGEGGLVVQRVQHVGAYVDHLKAMHREGFHGRPDMKFAGSIPNVVIEDYLNKNSLTLREFMQARSEHLPRILNDPAYADLRVWRGRI